MKKPQIVMTFGTFDVLHPGHLFYLSEAKELWDYLFTIVARDKTVEKIKWNIPRNWEDTRKKALMQSNIPDEVVLGDMMNHYSVILEKKPDILCFGYDQKSFNDEKLDEYLKNNHLSPKIVILPPFEPERWKSSKL